MNEKWEATKWVFWSMGVLVLLTVLGWLLLPINMRVQREVFIHSHQYQEGMADRRATLEAALAEVESQLSLNPDPTTRATLEAHRRTLSAQLNAARR